MIITRIKMHQLKQKHHKHFRHRRRPQSSSHNLSIGENNHYLLTSSELERSENMHESLIMHKPKYSYCSNLNMINNKLMMLIATLASLVFLQTLPQYSVAQLSVRQQQPSPSQQQQQQQQQAYLIPNHNLENLHISEALEPETIVHTLKALDIRNENRRFTYSLASDYLKVDEVTGEIRLTKPLDREQKSEFNAVVSVFDASDSKSDVPVDSRRRTIFVDDIDDSWPQFANHKTATPQFSAAQKSSKIQYRAEISESAPLNSLIISDILVTDADEPRNVDLVFECRAKNSTNSACETFSLESRRISLGRYSLSVRTRAPLDFERVQSYLMTLVARSRNPSPLTGTPLETETILEIKVLNVQDEGPIFANAPYSVSVHEGEPNGMRLLQVIVQDGDLAPQRQISVIVAPGPFSKYFVLTKATTTSDVWYLETTERTIDREDPLISKVGNIFNISLVAVELNEQGRPVASDEELTNVLSEPYFPKGSARKEIVTIIVEDKLDSTPIFVHTSTGKELSSDRVLVYNISESIAAGASLPSLDLEVVDFDLGVNSRFNLSLLDGDLGPPASAALVLESEIVYGRSEVVLRVLNASLLDYENPSLRNYRFSIIASKISPNNASSATPLLKSIELSINILDSNDNWPEFERNQFVLEVREDAKPGTQVGLIQAHDKDSQLYGKLTYTLTGQGSVNFKVGSETGAISVIDCGRAHCIDYEIEQSYSLLYEARDGGNKATNVSLLINVLDVNDHLPLFSEPIYRRELISDNLSNKQNYISPQLIVKARDGDKSNNITYSIRNSNLTGLDVHRNSGLVYLSEPFDLDVLIANIEEKKDQANEHMQSNSIPLRRTLFEAEVIADDNGSPPLQSVAKIHLSVRGNRDGAPQFKQDSYVAYVTEQFPVNKSFFQVQAHDPDDKDSQLRYSLGNDLNDILQINAQTGELSFKELVDYDDLRGLPYNITVHATDSTRPQPLKVSAPMSVIVQDINNKPPRFIEHDYRTQLVQAKTKLGDQLMQVQAIDPDKTAKLNYSIIHELISVRDRNGLEFNVGELLMPSSLNLQSQEQQMSKFDSQELAKSLKSLFAINKTSGVITLKSEPDYTFAASISVPIKVVDLSQQLQDLTGSNNNIIAQQQQFDIAHCIFLLQNHIDSRPIFAPPWSINSHDYNLTILEELPLGSVIFSLLAKDPATSQKIELFEKLFESDPKNYFRVDRLGMIYVNNRIDFEQLAASSGSASSRKLLRLSAKAIGPDNSYSIANLNIQVVDLNDNAPQFKFAEPNQQQYQVEVSEAIQYPYEVLTIQADDRDSQESSSKQQISYSISSSYESKFFTIDSRRGIISLRKDAKLDRETEPIHNLVVTASDCVPLDERATATTTTISSLVANVANCKKSSTIVKIILLDENDNDPVFVNVNERSEFETLVSETITLGSVITQVQAKDLDQGLNGKISYEIMVNPEEPMTRQITIDRDGYIRVVESLSGMGRANPYKILIKATDNGKPSQRQSFATLLLTIDDIVANDGVPRFIRPQPNEIVYISESFGANMFVYEVKAEDPEQDGKVMYKFDRKSDNFEIDPFSGVIRTLNRHNNNGLDREKVPNYTLIVIAQDLMMPTKQNSQVLTIKLTDVNDNEPIFERGIDDAPVVFTINEELPRDTLIGIIQAHDRDIGANALIDYEIIDGNQQNLFKINFEPNATHAMLGNNPCRIYSNGRLDREMQSSYTLTIRANSLSKRSNPFNSFQHQSNPDPLLGRNPFNQYNPKDLTKIRVTIILLDINDNRPVFTDTNAKSVVDSSAQVYSQLMSFKAYDPDSSNNDIRYSIQDAFFYSDNANKQPTYGLSAREIGSKQTHFGPISARGVFDIDHRKGTLRNVVSLRPYIDGHFEVYVKADSGSYNDKDDDPDANGIGKCAESAYETTEPSSTAHNNNDPQSTNFTQKVKPFAEIENCLISVTKGVIFVTQQRETFRLVFNKTRLNDRFEEFKSKMEKALEEIMFEPLEALSSTSQNEGKSAVPIINGDTTSYKFNGGEKLLLNTFNTEYYERDDGSLDFSTFTSCSQLIRFEDLHQSQQNDQQVEPSTRHGLPYDSQAINYHQARSNPNSINNLLPNQGPTQLVNYDQVMNLLKTLNQTQTRHQAKMPSLFIQYGLVNIERCLPSDRTHYRMSLSEKISLYLAGSIAVFGALATLIVSQMRKSYEKNLRILQRSRYQYMWNWEQQ